MSPLSMMIPRKTQRVNGSSGKKLTRGIVRRRYDAETAADMQKALIAGTIPAALQKTVKDGYAVFYFIYRLVYA